MPALVKFHCFVGDLGKKIHDLDTDDLKIALSNTAPNQATNTVLTDITEIAAGNGYPAGGPSLDNVTYGQTSGLAKLIADDETLTASGGTIGPFRYIILYNNTHASKPLIGYWDRGAGLTLQAGESWLLDLSPTNGILQVQ